ncbi:hypothetical protein ETD83_02385 [Actinomadura soli]|uniref:Lecithin:cholesterol acyltransferase n=1 Tax=Actinomadura soli TaxID=2508997 RepID=A0A5C4JJ73_9ACTN|nr:hypothetical protein [Actinomadura soli]TMR07007.1 hypothetical protein ETD83_02385 [Actinomadura soli]
MLIVPGIMGSELVEDESGKQLWGLRDPRWYVQAWTSGRSLARLRLTDEERAGRYGRIRPGGLLRFPAFAPLLRGFEPYTDLVTGLRKVCADPAAVATFPYDWRLPVAYNAGLLAKAADRHLTGWRAHPACEAARRASADQGPARLVVVAHSMGGLLARQLGLISGAADDVRATVTFGTPFSGAPKAALLLAAGRGSPALPARRLRELAVTLPGVYDLLPTYRCVDTGADARALTASDITGMDADPGLWQDSARDAADREQVLPSGHVRVVGTDQPTVQAVTLKDGVVAGHRYTCRPSADGGVERADRRGDGTVPRDSAWIRDSTGQPLAQTHGAMARCAEALVVASDVLADRDTGPWQGETRLGLDVPDVVPAGEPIPFTVTGAGHPARVTCRVTDAETGRQAAAPKLERSGDGHRAVIGGRRPGLYRLRVAGGGASPVTQLFLVSGG